MHLGEFNRAHSIRYCRMPKWSPAVDIVSECSVVRNIVVQGMRRVSEKTTRTSCTIRKSSAEQGKARVSPILPIKLLDREFSNSGSFRWYHAHAYSHRQVLAGDSIRRAVACENLYACANFVLRAARLLMPLPFLLQGPLGVGAQS